MPRSLAGPSAAVLAAGLLLAPAVAADPPAKAEPQRIGLWNGRAPQGDGTFEAADAFITIHRRRTGTVTPPRP